VTWSAEFAQDSIHLATDRIPRDDGERQTRTAREILRRLQNQPGLILADEVGMGKTFVALAVAASVVLTSKKKHPVVVMVPAALRDKWPREAQVFREKCLSDEARRLFTFDLATNGVEFFKLMDDPRDRRKAVVFLTHGALNHGLNDPWVKLALVRETFRKRRSLHNIRRAFPRMAGRLLRMKWRRLEPEDYERLLNTPPFQWRQFLGGIGIELDDDPVPAALVETMRLVDKKPVIEALQHLPLYESASIDQRLAVAREHLARGVNQVWADWLSMTDVRSPLLILDEAHHFKNPHTRHASLFQDADAAGDAELVQGPLAGVFDRMLFLTATPFQLGHRELIQVLRHFQAIRWKSSRAPESGKETFLEQITELEKALNEAQLSALRFEAVWGRLKEENIADLDGNGMPPDRWWASIADSGGSTALETQIWKQYVHARTVIEKSGKALRPWVIRHGRPTQLPNGCGPRRIPLEGAAIEADEPLPAETGLELEGPSLLPFLLAARASVALEAAIRRGDRTGSRALFAEGLASSYESYLSSRSRADGRDEDAAGESSDTNGDNGDLEWYLSHLDRVLPTDSLASRLSHPKVASTVRRALELWKSGEKVVIFCHYIATGRALREHLSRQMEDWIRRRAMEQLAEADPDAADRRLDNLADSFFKEDGLRPVVERELSAVIGEASRLDEHERGEVVEVMRRFVRTPTFLVRFFPLDDESRSRAFRSSLEREDASGMTLREQILHLCDFLANRCTASEREAYLQALKTIQTGRIRGDEARLSFASDEDLRGSESFLPNVRFVFGETKPETRRTLMLAFNTPFFPEILVSSSVLAEGVDLHLNCRHVIHHDLDWNPSTLEQRTGRVDRLGAKAERARKPIRVYLPYVAGTHDEKQYKVVRDRERWFHIVMGEQMALDEWSTERIAGRVPLPEAAAAGLTMNLSL